MLRKKGEELMKNVMKRLITFVLTIAIISGSLQMYHEIVSAADSTVKIYLGDSTTARHHKEPD